MPTPSVDNMEGRKLFKDIDITKDEADRIAKAFENEEFRKLFKEYAEEISDPENRKRYEEELALLEGERGMDVKFVNPDPGYVIKTTQNGETKVFINICKNENIAKPTAQKQQDDKGRSGLNWLIPHSFAPPREDVDKAQGKCMVYDVVFNPDTYRMAERNARFKNLIHDTALEGIENQFGVKLDKKNLKFPKMKFKGVARPTVIRNKKSEGAKELDPSDPLSKMPYPYDDIPSDVKAKENEKKNKNKANIAQRKETGHGDNNDDYTQPKFTITHRNEFDLQNFTSSGPRDCDTCPKELVVSIDLPLLSSSNNVNLDIFEKQLVLLSEKPAKYKLELDLPYIVDEENGSAKFDKTKRKLIVTLPVVKNSSVTHDDNAGSNLVETYDPKEEVTTNDERATNDLKSTNDDIVVDVKPETCQDENTNNIVISSSDVILSTLDDGDKLENARDTASSEEEKDISETSPTEVEPEHSTDNDKVYYIEPPFDMQQDELTISIIIKVNNIQGHSLSKVYPGEAGFAFSVKFVSMGMGGFPIHYSFLVKAPEGRKFKTASSNVVVEDNLIVILLTKEKADCELWDKVSVGKDEASLKEKLFVTDKNLRSELKDLEAAATMPSPESSPEIHVTDMNENKLSIDIKGRSGSDEAALPKNSPDLNSSVTTVQEQKMVPKLQSILKQRSRTVSESSDEVFSYSRENSISLAGSESPISESEEGEERTGRTRKKSVSFSEKVDQQMFKQNQPTTTLRNTLKNKRKSQRKNEKKNQQKAERSNRRHRSSDSISEMSSDGEGNWTNSDVSATSPEDNKSKVPTTQELVDNQSYINNSKTMEDANGNVATKEATDTANDQKSKKSNRRKNRRNKKQATKGDATASNGHEPPETTSPSSQSEGEGKSDECCDNEKIVPKNKKLVEVVQDDGHDSDDDNKDAGLYLKDELRTNKPNGTSPMEEENKAAGDRVKCPVSFSNSVMFDLD